MTRTRSAGLLVWIAFALIAVASAYFALKIFQLAGWPGYDFRFVWLAGDLWNAGVNPYDTELYQAAAAEVFLQGHQPEKWVYPPTWWGVTVLYAGFSPETANVLWNIWTVVLIAVSCLLLVSSFYRAFPEVERRIGSAIGGGPVHLLTFAGLYFFMSVLEATAIHLSVGQTTAYCLLGIALLLVGLQREHLLLSALGVLVLMLKPQIGLGFLIPVVFMGMAGWRIIGTAIVISLVLSIPALIIAPMAILDFVVNVAAYDGFTIANLPQSMTGLRHFVWEFTDADMGNKAAVAASLVAIAATVYLLMPRDAAQRTDRDHWRVIVAVTSLTLALAPLHVYDFVLIAAPLLMFLGGGRLVLALGGLGILMMLRSENLADVTGFYREGVDIFPGSRLMSIGACLFAAASLISITTSDRAQAAKSEDRA